MATPSGEVGLLTPEGHGSTGRIGAAASSARCSPSGEVGLLTPEGHGSTRLGDTIEAGFVEGAVDEGLAVEVVELTSPPNFCIFLFCLFCFFLLDLEVF